jgi:hypothetical protein
VSAELVGPVPVIMFGDGTRQVYDVPRDTMDIRYAACRDHHPACDCREAHHAEDIGEYRAERREIEAAFAAELADHATWPPWTDDPDGAFQVCSCTGCRIARRVRWVRSSFDTEKDRRACRVPRAGHLTIDPECLAEDVPF